MALTLASFSKPDLFAFHLTERVNMARIERLSLLESAERLLVRLNADRLRLCAVNSGQTGARMKMVPRGPDTYAPLERFAGTRRDVKELVFHDHAALPASRALLDINLVLSSAG